MRGLRAPGTPQYQPQQRRLDRQAQPQRPQRHREQVRPLQHVDVRRRHGQSQQEQADAGGAAGGGDQDAGGAQQLEHAADQHRRHRPRHPGRDDAGFGGGRCEMHDAADEEPQEDKGEAGDLALADGACRRRDL